MSKVVVADSTCLIGLSKIAKLDILRHLFDTILIPPAVFQEVAVLGKGRPGASEVVSSEWIQTHPIADQFAVDTLRMNLGAGNRKP